VAVGCFAVVLVDCYSSVAVDYFELGFLRLLFRKIGKTAFLPVPDFHNYCK